MVSKDIPNFVRNAVGDIPKEWSLHPMPDVVYFQEGPGLRNWQYRESGTPFLNIRCIKEDGTIDLDSVQYISNEEAEQKYQHFMLEAGDTVLSSSGTLGRMAVIREEHLPLMLNTSIIRFRSLSEHMLDNSYMRFFLLSTGFAKQFSFESQGSAQSNFGPTHLKKMFMPIPPLGEQSKIAAILTSVDDAITATQRVIDQIEDVKRGLMQQLLTRGIGHTTFKHTEIGEIPTEWDVVKLSDCADIKSGVTKGRKVNGQQLVSVPYLRVANVQDGYLDLNEIKYIDVTYEELERYRLNNGDVLLTEGGDADKLGRGYIWREEVLECIHQNHVFRVRTDSKVLLPEYLTYLAASPYGKRYFLGCAKQTTNLASINSTQLKEFPVPLPSLTEQEHIASTFTVFDKKLTTEKSTREGLTMVKQSLMQVLLTGKVRVNVDEPSEVSV
jgi:type I restriction enzyme, S subunit